jgi:hypothetical protein
MREFMSESLKLMANQSYGDLFIEEVVGDFNPRS